MREKKIFLSMYLKVKLQFLIVILVYLIISKTFLNPASCSTYVYYYSFVHILIVNLDFCTGNNVFSYLLLSRHLLIMVALFLIFQFLTYFRFLSRGESN